MSKQIKAMFEKHPEKFDEWWVEYNDDQKQYWVYCKDPYFCEFQEGQLIIEHTVKEVVDRMKRVVKGKRVEHEVDGVLLWSGWEREVSDE